MNGFDRAAVHAHVLTLHSLAQGIDGVLVLACYGENPATGIKVGEVVERFAVGDVDSMADAIMAKEDMPHLNVYCGWHVMRRGLTGRQRGGLGDLVAVLGLPVDLDADTGKTGALPLEPPYVIESSAGNFQPVYPLARPLRPAEAQPIAEALQLATGSDHGTKDLAHIWRVPGTLNHPNKKKADRGRPLAPQPVKVASAWTGELIEPEALLAAVAKPNGANHTSGDWQIVFAALPASLKKLIASPPEAGEDRSAVAASVILSLIGRGWSDDKIATVITAHPQGIGARYAEGSDLEADIVRLRGKRESAEPAVTPIDLWAKLDPPALPLGLLPEVIERFAVEQGELMGADPVGLAMAALCVCAAAIPDCVELQVKQHDPSWRVSTRLWVGEIGDPSTKKSPILRQAVRPLVRLDAELARRYAAEKAKYDNLSAEERKNIDPPKKKRLRIEDTTIEAAQEILKDSHNGVLCLQDELSGWFGAMEKYSSGRGAQRDRAFWLQAWNGGEYVSDRVGRGTCCIPNLSISLLGGIQPEPMSRILIDTVDDGLIQRIVPVILRSATVGKDEEKPDAVRAYEHLVERLAGKQALGGLHDRAPMTVRLSFGAQAVRQRLEQRHNDLTVGFRSLSPKLCAHLGKYDGIFAQLCLIWHCIEADWIDPVSERVALRVEKFLHSFLLPHAVTFYNSTLEHDPSADVAGHILAHRLEIVTNRDLARCVRSMKGLSRTETTPVLERLDALGWLTQVPGPRPMSPPQWRVNPECHRLFAERAERETVRRQNSQKLMREVFMGVSQ